MCTVLLPPGDNPIAVNKYIRLYFMYFYWKRLCILIVSLCILIVSLCILIVVYVLSMYS